MSDSRENILQNIRQNQAPKVDLPLIDNLFEEYENPKDTFIAILESIGGKVIEVNAYEEITQYIKANYNDSCRIISNSKKTQNIGEESWQKNTPHSLENVDFALFDGHFGVAENGAIWLTEEQMGQRVAPFITQYLGIVIHAKDIVSTMHQAYQRIANSNYTFGTFLAGPSKTADIEQSLVLGAHGARTLVVFLLNNRGKKRGTNS